MNGRMKSNKNFTMPYYSCLFEITDTVLYDICEKAPWMQVMYMRGLVRSGAENGQHCFKLFYEN